MKNISRIDPSLLNLNTQKQPLEIFLCGPGYESSRYKIREEIRDYLNNFTGIRVVYGEELGSEGFKKRLPKGSNIQALEMAYAHLVDFTILILESPGAIAELGTFSMVKSLYTRVFAIIPAVYHKSESYIARGPLSILSAHSSINVSYYSVDNIPLLHHNLNWAVMVYKIIRNNYPEYQNYLTHPNKKGEEYHEFIKPKIDAAKASIALAVINMLDSPTFSELVHFLFMSPSEVSGILRILYENESIRKDKLNRYHSNKPYTDRLLDNFNSSYLSKRKAELLAL